MSETKNRNVHLPDFKAKGGLKAVRDFIASAASAADVEKARPDIFLALRESRLPKEAEFER